MFSVASLFSFEGIVATLFFFGVDILLVRTLYLLHKSDKVDNNNK